MDMATMGINPNQITNTIFIKTTSLNESIAYYCEHLHSSLESRDETSAQIKVGSVVIYLTTDATEISFEENEITVSPKEDLQLNFIS